MAYTKTNWLARTGTGLNKYKDTNDNDRVLALVHDPDTITQNGTPFSAENMNKIEQGIYDAHVTADGAVKASGGDTANTKVASFTASSAAYPVPAAGETHKTMWGKVVKFFGDVGTRLGQLKGLSNKDKTVAGDYTAGSIVNADISASAAIAFGKLSGVAAASHPHGNVTNDGKIGTAADKIVCTEANGVMNAKTVADLKALFLDITHPVGSIFMSASFSTAAQVAAAMGGTWVAWGAGRVPVGVGSGVFANAEATGGSADAIVPLHSHSYNAPPSATDGHALTLAEMPSHTHRPVGTVGTNHDNTTKIMMNTDAPTTEAQSDWNVTYAGGDQSHNHGITAAAGTTGNAGAAATNANLQPYITCYMYKRTA